MDDTPALHHEMVALCLSLFQRGYAHGSAGNVSIRLADGFLVSPTRSSLGRLDPARLSRLDRKGAHLSGDKPSKEVPMHLAYYAARPEACAIVHLHSPYATLLSCLPVSDPENALPPATPYLWMNVGPVPVVDFAPPGSQALAELVGKAAIGARAILMANHGFLVGGPDLATACDIAEELERSAEIAVRGGNALRLIPQDALKTLPSP
jgi:ribulose-5-phosphate 4-epimerase/fuculose-1-phosphate aldolase